MDQIQLHTAGATVQHQSPFDSLEISVCSEIPTLDIREKWIKPFYFGLRDAAVEPALKTVWRDIDEAIVKKLLSYFDWRPRIVGAYLASLKNFNSYDDHIGRLLLRSDVCFAGVGYCLALATFNTPTSVHALKSYLDYYLGRSDLWFDQNQAMAAIAYLDECNGTNDLAKYMKSWEKFVENKPNWDLATAITRFSEQMNRLTDLGKICS